MSLSPINQNNLFLLDKYLLEFIEYCKSNYNLSCILFTTLKDIKYSHKTNDLQIYASLMDNI